MAIAEQPVRRTGVRTVVDRIQKIDVRSTWQVAAGAVLVPLGVVVILIAWYGSAHTAYVQQQIPYLVSGSFLGLGMMVLGGLLYWAHWLYRVYDQADLQHAAQMRGQEELFERLIEAVRYAGPAAAVPPAAAPSANGHPVEHTTSANGSASFVATATGSNVHRPDCPVVGRHPGGLRRVSGAQAAAMKPCRICQPDLTPTR